MFLQINRIVYLIIASILVSCASDKNNPNEPNSIEDIFISDVISVKNIKEETSQDIGSSGGILVISNPESSLNGLSITVPSNGYSEIRNYSILSAQITNHKLGVYFNPISPIISISNGGGYSNTPMRIKIPIEKSEDDFVICFLYNEITGGIEVLPVVELTNESITVETRHFALSSVVSESNLGKISENDARGNMVISSIDESELTGQTVISSGFNPGFDDWEFINYGSYIAPGGHCAGQSLTAMWYFYEKRLRGESSLFHQFDLVNNIDKPVLLWQDNPDGYRFASTIQMDFNWDGWVEEVDIQSRDPKMTYFTFIGALLTTGEPQSVIIKKTDTDKGHAMIIYKIDVTDGLLYVADPNYPANRSSLGLESVRTIKYSNDKFEPYPSFAKVGDPGTIYDQIAFFGKTANIDWSQISKRYQELENGTIGDDRFPNYDLKVKTDEGTIPLAHDMTMKDELFKFYCKNTNIQESLPGTEGLQPIYLFNDSGSLVAQNDEEGMVSVKLSEGKNNLGVYVSVYNGEKASRYYDFQWFAVHYEPEDSNTYNDPCSGILTVTYGGKTYNTVQIGNQCWLKENINIGKMISTTPDQEQDQENNGIIEKYCYDNDSTNCEKYGGLYQWDEAMQYSNSEGSQGICPEGWHIPTLAEFETLIAAINNDGNALKAIGEGSGDGAGTDTTSFSAFLSGYTASNIYYYIGEYGSFWTSTELGSFDKVNSMYLNYYDGEINLVNNAKKTGFSIRCVKD